MTERIRKKEDNRIMLYGNFINATFIGKPNKKGKRNPRRRYYINISDKKGEVIEAGKFPFEDGSLVAIEVQKDKLIVRRARIVIDE